MNKHDKEAQHWIKKDNWEDKREAESLKAVTWMAGILGYGLIVWCVFEFLMGV
jgi:hypothetical protein